MKIEELDRFNSELKYGMDFADEKEESIVIDKNDVRYVNYLKLLCGDCVLSEYWCRKEFERERDVYGL